MPHLWLGNVRVHVVHLCTHGSLPHSPPFLASLRLIILFIFNPTLALLGVLMNSFLSMCISSTHRSIDCCPLYRTGVPVSVLSIHQCDVMWCVGWGLMLSGLACLLSIHPSRIDLCTLLTSVLTLLLIILIILSAVPRSFVPSFVRTFLRSFPSFRSHVHLIDCCSFPAVPYLAGDRVLMDSQDRNRDVMSCDVMMWSVGWFCLVSLP